MASIEDKDLYCLVCKDKAGATRMWWTEGSVERRALLKFLQRVTPPKDYFGLCMVG